MSGSTERHESAVARYLEAWNATEPEALRKAVAAAWTADGSHTDPLADVRGHEQIAAVIAAVHEQFPGFAFRLLCTVDGRHDIARFGWELVNQADGPAPVAGSDVLTLDGEGRIRPVTGFLDRMPAQA
ncbi:nuclear transport factor 2 family protein [Streptomyces sp. TG1A-8]|uniref:nuclear transport factor 2 family protein n=1 Tax=Streptomyces sp. TG1A-8 TaxID=3051385 RepID=UPI00265BCAB7|nr:nuclear transport factor 2 family protein [Streptomyces sp. TG1A-8]MDO0929148.1 nuclear transport factor 2 family protein [Streptomyces sp. TG1A-8]